MFSFTPYVMIATTLSMQLKTAHTNKHVQQICHVYIAYAHIGPFQAYYFQ